MILDWLRVVSLSSNSKSTGVGYLLTCQTFPLPSTAVIRIPNHFNIVLQRLKWKMMTKSCSGGIFCEISIFLSETIWESSDSDYILFCHVVGLL